MTKTKITQEDRDFAIKYLKTMLPVGARVYTKLEHVSTSGMSRVISFYVPLLGDTETGELYIHSLNYYTAQALDMKLDPKHNGGIKVSGCGMDMGYHLVSNLAHALYEDASALKHSWL